MFDNKTLIIGELLLPLAFMIIQLIEFGWTDKQAVKVNIAANFFQFFGFLFLLLRNLIPCVLTVGLSSAFILICIIFMLITTYQIFNVKVPLLAFKILGATILFSIIFFSFIGLTFVRFSIMSIGFGIICLYGSVYLCTHVKKKKRNFLYIISSEFIVLGLLSISRFIFFSDNTSFTNYIVDSSLFILIWNYTIQLKRNSIIMDDIKQSSKLLYKTQEDLSILNHIYYEENKPNSLQNLYEQIFDLLKSRFNIQKAIIYINDKGKFSPEYSVGFLSHEVEFLANENKSNGSIEIIEEFVGNLSDGAYKDLLLNKGLLGGITYPLITRGHSVGALFIGIVSSSTIVNSDKEIVLSICRQVAGIIHNAQMYNKALETQSKLKEMSTTDNLTGIYNRREFFIQFASEFSSTKRHNDDITIFMVDIDNIKRLNEQFGHEAGDQALISVVNTIQSQLRTNDLFARYGGEELIGVLLRSDREGTVKKLKNLVLDISKITIPNYPLMNITVSIGCCHYSSEFNSIEAMIKRADIALYKAKKSGKNCLWVD